MGSPSCNTKSKFSQGKLTISPSWKDISRAPKANENASVVYTSNLDVVVPNNTNADRTFYNPMSVKVITNDLPGDYDPIELNGSDTINLRDILRYLFPQCNITQTEDDNGSDNDIYTQEIDPDMVTQHINTSPKAQHGHSY